MWCDVSYDDTEWMNVEVYSLDLKLSDQKVEGNKKLVKIKPVAIEERADGTYRIDMGVNFAGWTEVKVKGKEGQEIEYLYSERERDDMTFNRRSGIMINDMG